ncbi:MAG: hypothetical protein JNL81_08555 [Hyphomonadaceae bacterium]|nr:hypothetical protein [Hyphomonadaceae bacterium]
MGLDDDVAARAVTIFEDRERQERRAGRVSFWILLFAGACGGVYLALRYESFRSGVSLIFFALLVIMLAVSARWRPWARTGLMRDSILQAAAEQQRDPPDVRSSAAAKTILEHGQAVRLTMAEHARREQAQQQHDDERRATEQRAADEARYAEFVRQAAAGAPLPFALWAEQKSKEELWGLSVGALLRALDAAYGGRRIVDGFFQRQIGHIVLSDVERVQKQLERSQGETLYELAKNRLRLEANLRERKRRSEVLEHIDGLWDQWDDARRTSNTPRANRIEAEIDRLYASLRR